MRTLPFLLLFAGPAAAAPAPATPDPVQAEVQAASEVYAAVAARHAAGGASAEEVYLWSMRWLQAEQAAGKAGAAEAHHQRMAALAEAVARQVNAGLAPASDASAARYYVAEAEVLAR